MNLEFRLFPGKIKLNELISKKYKKVCRTLNYTEHLLILASTVTGWISISSFASLIVAIASCAVGIKICAIPGIIKKYKSIIRTIKAKALIDSNISHDEFVLIKNVLKEYDLNEKIKNPKMNVK